MEINVIFGINVNTSSIYRREGTNLDTQILPKKTTFDFRNS